MTATHTLHVWHEGQHIGTFQVTSPYDITFTYDTNAPCTPLSLSLPRDGEWSKNAPRNFLQNLLPEKGTRLWMARFTQTDSDDFSLLDQADTVGGVTFTTHDEPPQTSPKPLVRMTDRQIAARITALKYDSNDRWENDPVNKVSLAGAQAKFSLTRKGDGWYRSNDITPSTHIFKPEAQRTRDAELVEHADMRLSALCRIDTPRTSIAWFEDQHAFCVERFDRKTSPAGRIRRVQCEDFLQALGMPTETEILASGQADHRVAAQNRPDRQPCLPVGGTPRVQREYQQRRRSRQELFGPVG